MVTTWVQPVAILTAVLCGGLFAPHARSEEPLKSEAEAFLKEHSNQNSDSIWERNFQRRAAEAMQDNQSISSAERFAVDKVLEFFFDKKKHFDVSSANPLSAKDKIEVARWYVLFSRNGWRFPSRIAEHLTKNNYERYMEVNREEKTPRYVQK